MPNPSMDDSASDLFTTLSRDSAGLIQDDIALARAELRQATDQAAGYVAVIVLGGILSLSGIIALTIAAGLALSHVMRPWLAALTVGAVELLLGGMMAFIAWRALRNIDFMPRRTIRTLYDQAAWLRDKVH